MTDDTDQELFDYHSAEPPGPRPDIVDLTGPWFDRPEGEPARKTLIICAAPRTGSFELSRMLMAAGIGVGHEYFHPKYAGILAARWGLPGSPLAPDQIEAYIAGLKRLRAKGDVFATKLQYWQYRSALCNKHGASLFQRAVVVHLFRADVFRQFVSFHEALESGRYDFSERRTHPPRDAALLFNERRLMSLIDSMTMEDTGFRRLFILLGICPIFVQFDQFTKNPASVIETIGRALDVTVDHAGLESAIALAGAYRGERKKDEGRERALLAITTRLAFQK